MKTEVASGPPLQRPKEISTQKPYSRMIHITYSCITLTPLLWDILALLNSVNCEWTRRTPFCLSSLKLIWEQVLPQSPHSILDLWGLIHTDDKRKQRQVNCYPSEQYWLYLPTSRLLQSGGPSQGRAQTYPYQHPGQTKVEEAKNREKLGRTPKSPSCQSKGFYFLLAHWKLQLLTTYRQSFPSNAPWGEDGIVLSQGGSGRVWRRGGAWASLEADLCCRCVVTGE